MYVAKHVGRWSTTVIGRFYNGRDHSTVCHGIQRIEALRESDPEVDLLVSDLKHELTSMDPNTREITDETSDSRFTSLCNLEPLADLIAEKVIRHLEQKASGK
jgi:Bacterial dnaA protein helix-turn-helix